MSAGDVVDTNLQHLRNERIDDETDDSEDETVIDKVDAFPFASKISPKPKENTVVINKDVDHDKIPEIINGEYFDMTHPNRGVAIILNHKYFENMNTRQGTTKDCKDVESALTSLHFDVHVCTDYKYEDVKGKIKQIASMNHTHNDCLVIVGMTHGEPGMLFAKDRDYHLTELWEPFVGDNCPSLIGKPKLIFLQACRGAKLDRGSIARMTRKMSDAVDGQAVQTSPIIFSIPTMADVLIMYATFDDHYAWRNPKDGSWFIQSLCKELVKNPHESLSTILINVTRRVAFEYQSNVPDNKTMDGMKQIPCTVSMLTKTLYFTKKGTRDEKMDEV